MNLKTVSVAFFLFNIFIKLLLVGTIPPILTDAEMYYATEAQSIIKGGTDTSGKWHPTDLNSAHPSYSELTGAAMIPGFLLFPHQPLLAIKFMPVFLGSLLPILLALIVLRVTKSSGAFITTAFVASVNPWIFQFSRMNFDSLYSSTFYTLGIVILLYLKGWKILWSVLPFVLGFYQYQGHKPLLVPLVAISVLYLIIEKRRILLHHIVLITLVIIFVGIHLWRLPHLSSSVRLQNEMFFDKTAIAKQVDLNRRLTLENPLSPVFDNKYSLIFKQSLERFIASFDIKWIFIQGDARVDTFSVTDFGFFYPLDAVLIMAAVVALWSSKIWRLGAFYLSGIILIGVLPNILKNEQVWITLRSSFMFLGLVMLSGIGAYALLSNKKKFIKVCLVLFYVICTIPFFYYYFFRYPIITTKDNFFYDRIVANYLQRQPERQFIIYSQSPRTLFDGILTYNQLITKENLTDINTAYQTEIFKLSKVRVVGECLNLKDTENPDLTVLADYRKATCDKTPPDKVSTPHVQISSLIDSGAKYLIYNDQLCRSFELNTYLRVQKNIFDIEKLSNENFCRSFFTSSQ